MDLDDKLLKTLTIGFYAVLVTPLLVWHNLIYPFITPKVFVVMPLIGVLVAIWAVFLVRGVLPRPRWTRTTIALAAFLVALIVSALLGVDPARSFWSTQERGFGIIAFLHFAALVCMLQSARGHIDFDRYLTFSFAVSSVAAFFTFVHIVDPPFFFDAEATNWASVRPGSFLGNPTYLAGYLLPHIFIGLYLAFRRFLDRNRRMFAVLSVGVFLNVVALFLTQTRGALIGLFAGTLVLAAYVAWREKSTRVFGIPLRKIAAGALVLALMFPVAFFLTRGAPIWQSIPGIKRLTTLTLSSPEIQPRLITIGIALTAFRERPIFGFGFENFKYPFDAHYDPRLLRSGFGETYFDKPHNIVLEYLVTTGIVGLLAYLALTAVLCAQLLRTPGMRLFAPFGLALLAANFGQNVFVFDTYGSYLTFFLLIGFVAVREMSESDVHPRQVPAPAWRFRDSALVGIAGFVAAAWLFANACIVYANHLQFWGFNYFANAVPEPGIVSYEQALAMPVNPYRDLMKRDFLSILVQGHTQGLKIPDLDEQVKKRAADLLEVTIRHPNDYFTLISFADAMTVFPKIDPGFLREGDTAIDKALVASPNRQQAYYVLSKLKFLEGDTSGALEAIRKAVELDPQIGISHYYYGLIAFETGDRALGLSEFAAAEDLGWGPETQHEKYMVATHYAEAGNAVGDAGDYAKAITFYTKALDAAPADLELRLKLGISHYYAGNFDEASRFIGEVSAQIQFTKTPSFSLLKPILEELHVSFR